MMDLSALRDARDPSRAGDDDDANHRPRGRVRARCVRRESRVRRRGASKSARDGSNHSTGVDALFGAMRDDARAVTTVESAGSENAIESAMRTMRETLVTMTAPLFATSGREAEATLGGGGGTRSGRDGARRESEVRGGGVRMPTLGA